MKHRCGTCQQFNDIFRRLAEAARDWTPEQKAEVRAELDRKLPSKPDWIN